VPATSLTSAAVAKLRSTDARQVIRDGASQSLYLVVQPSGHKSWLMRFRKPNGKIAKLVLGPVDLSGAETSGEPEIGMPLTLKAARHLAAKVQRNRALGADVVADHKAQKRRRRSEAVERSERTFSVMARKFADEHTVAKKGRKPRDWKEVARILGWSYPKDDGEPTLVKGGLAERWQDKPAKDVDGHDVYGVIDEARRQGIPGMRRGTKGNSDARARKMSLALSGMFKFLVRHRHVATDPTVGVWRPSAPERRSRVLNFRVDVRRADELRFFWRACDAIPAPFGDLFKVLLLTGCRREEIAQMRDDELTDDASALRLAGDRTKNGLEHEVPLAPLARAIIGRVPRAVAPSGKNTSLVFSTTGYSAVSGFTKMKQKLDAAMLEEAKKEHGDNAAVAPWRLHDLRRTCATGMARIGIAPHIIEAALNHVSGAKAGVAGTYNREDYLPERKVAMERWAAYVESVVLSSAASNVVPMRDAS
jgi:integrase